MAQPFWNFYQFKTLFDLNGIQRSEYVSMSSKTTPTIVVNVFFVKLILLAGLIVKHLDLGPTTDQLTNN